MPGRAPSHGPDLPDASHDLARAIPLLRAGRPVLLYDADGREEETDLFVAAEHATPEAIRTLRRDAGGLVFCAVAPEVGRKLALPFLQDLYAEDAKRHPILGRLVPNDIAYDTRSSFSLTINHRRTFTGITDRDRSLTVTELARLAAESRALSPDEAQKRFGERFRAPGHVHLCVGADGLLARRQGHTELGVALAEIAGVVPILVGAEMLADDGGRLAREDATRWADAHGTVRLNGEDVIAAWTRFNEARAVAQAR